MLPDAGASGERARARLAHALESVRPVHTALGLPLDVAWASDLLGLYERRPAWAVPGSISPADALFLGEVIRAVRPRTVLEVGVAAGCSTSVLGWAAARWAPQGASPRVIAIDGADRWYLDAARPVGGAIDEILADDPVARASISVHPGRTAADAREILDGALVDAAFIDADHRHPWPVLDVIAVLPHVRPGGWILLHDTRLAELSARHERKTNEPAPWAQRGPANALAAWPGRTVHAATGSANVGALEVLGDIDAVRAALVASLDAFPWEADPTDPALQRALSAARPEAGPDRAPRGGTITTTARAGPSGGPVRIALVTREFPPAFGGGIGTAMAHIAAGLAGDGHTVHVITAATGPSDRVTRRTVSDGLVVHRVPVAREGVDWWASRADFAARSARVVEELARDGEIDVAEFPECEAPALVHAMAQCADGVVIPTVIQVHTPTEVVFGLGSGAYDHPCAGLACAMAGERAAIGLADGVYAPSRFIAEWAAQWWRLDATPPVVPYAHAPELGAPTPVRADGSPMVVYIGRLEPRKGVMVLAEAWNAVSARVPEAMLVLAGADTTHAVTGGSVKRAMVRAMTPQSAVRTLFLGAVPHGDVGGIIDRATVCVVPSVWENFPNVAIEAMGRGRPIVASDRGGMAEMIGDSRGGVVFRSGDPGHLAESLAAILSESPAALDARGRDAHRAITAVCDPVETTRARVALYRDAMARAHHRDRGRRAEWIEVATDVLRATGAGDWPAATRPVPGFGADLLRWVRPPRAMISTCTAAR